MCVRTAWRTPTPPRHTQCMSILLCDSLDSGTSISARASRCALPLPLRERSLRLTIRTDLDGRSVVSGCRVPLGGESSDLLACASEPATPFTVWPTIFRTRCAIRKRSGHLNVSSEESGGRRGGYVAHACRGRITNSPRRRRLAFEAGVPAAARRRPAATSAEGLVRSVSQG